MIALTIICCVLAVLVVILGFTTFNLLRKNEKQEDIVAGYLTYLDNLSRIIEISDKKLKELDRGGIFEKDDEVGVIFTETPVTSTYVKVLVVEKVSVLTVCNTCNTLPAGNLAVGNVPTVATEALTDTILF